MYKTLRNRANVFRSQDWIFVSNSQLAVSASNDKEEMFSILSHGY